MLCDVISAATEFMVRVLRSKGGAMRSHDLAGVEAQHAYEPIPLLSGVLCVVCDGISVVTEFMVSGQYHCSRTPFLPLPP
jgi:hypothetical protein